MRHLVIGRPEVSGERHKKNYPQESPLQSLTGKRDLELYNWAELTVHPPNAKQAAPMQWPALLEPLFVRLRNCVR